MAILTPAFRSDSERIHSEHEVLLDKLTEMERALDHLAVRPDALADGANIEVVRGVGLKLTVEWPDHCRREEEELLKTVAEVSPELSDFCRRMREEHQVLMAQLALFRVDLQDLKDACDSRAAVEHLIDDGTKLARALRQHVELEERELSGFL